MTLDQLAIAHGTDKASRHPVKGHNYARHYDAAFDPIRFHPIKVLEIGVGGGESIRMWLEYLPYALVWGLDKVQGTNPWNTVGSGVHPRYTFVYGDQTDRTMWKCFAADYGKDFDISIDDGGHFNDQIVISFEGLWPIVRPGGFYCIEDLGVGSTPGTVFLKPGFPTHMEFIKGMMDRMEELGIDSLAYSNELAILRKKPL